MGGGLACPLPDLVTLTGKELVCGARERSLPLLDPPLRLVPDDDGVTPALHDCLREEEEEEEERGVAMLRGVAGMEVDVLWCCWLEL